MTPSNLSREARIYLAIWRKAYRERDTEAEPVSLLVSSYSMALTVRNNMYRAIRPYRFGEAFDEELRKAAEAFVVSVMKNPDPASQHRITLKPRLSLSELELQFANLGLDETDLLLPEEASSQAKIAKILAPETPIRANKFYTRDD